MLLRAFIAIVTADAIDRHRRERQHRVWAAAEEARTAADAPPAPQSVSADFDPRRAERPI